MASLLQSKQLLANAGLLAVQLGANFLNTSLSCSAQRFLQHPVGRHVACWLILCTFIVSISTSDSALSDKNPVHTPFALSWDIAYLLLSGLISYIFFLFLSKCEAHVSVAVWLCVFVMLFLEWEQWRNNILYENRHAMLWTLSALILGLTLIGVILYAFKQRKDKGADFRWLTFFFGEGCERGKGASNSKT